MIVAVNQKLNRVTGILGLCQYQKNQFIEYCMCTGISQTVHGHTCICFVLAGMCACTQTLTLVCTHRTDDNQKVVYRYMWELLGKSKAYYHIQK